MNRILCRTTLLVASCSLFATACSTVAPPRTEIAAAEEAVNHALKGKSPKYAPEGFKLAESKLAEAKDEMKREHYVHARRLSEQSRADAEFADTTAEARYAREMLGETSEGVDAILDQMPKR